MNAVKEIRLTLGMGQKEFALVLGIERGYLSMIEVDRKSLPDYASEKLDILKRIIASTRVDEELKSNGTHPQLKKLRRKLALLDVELGNCQKKLGAMKTEFRAYTMQKRVLSIVLDSLRANSENKRSIQAIYATLLEQIDQVSPAEQLIVQLRIDEITHSMVLTEQAIVDMDTM